MDIKQRTSGILLLTVVFITGFSVFICTLTWLRHFLLFFGINITSIVIILSAFLLDLASGSRLFGKLSDRVAKQANLLFFLFTAIAAYSFIFGAAGTLAKNLNIWYTGKYSPDIFGVCVFRFVTALVFLFPASFTGGLYPVFSRMIIRNVSQTGQKTGIIIFLLSAGAIAGFCFISFYSVESTGFRNTLIFAASLMLLNGLCLRLIRNETIGSLSSLKRPLAQKVKKSGILLKNKKVLETEPKLTRTLLWVFTFQGFWSMIFLLVWIKSLLSVPGLDTYSLAKGILLTCLLAFGTGALLFRRLSSQTSKKFHLLGIIYMFTGIAAVISYVSFHFFQEELYGRYKIPPLLGTGIMNDILPPAVMLFIPALLIGATFPMASRLYPKRLEKTGFSIGHLCFIFITGAIAGLIITNFILIPVLGIYYVLFAAVIISILTGLILFLRDSRFRRSFRVFLLCIVLIVLGLIQSTFTRSDYGNFQTGLFSADSVQAIKQGIASTAVLVQNPDNTSVVYLNGKLLLKSDETTLRTGRRFAFIPSVILGRAESVYLSGFGTGVTASSLERYDYRSITVTETHPEIISFSSYAFSAFNNDILTRDVITITPEDSRSMLNRTNDDFDLILLNYEGPMARPDLYNTGFYGLASEGLAEGGVLCQLIPVEGLSGNRFLSILKSCSDIFPSVSVWYPGGTSLITVASKDSLWDYCDMNESYDRLKAVSATGYQSFEAFLGTMIMGDDEIREISEIYPVYSEDKPMWLLSEKISNTADPEMKDIFPVNRINYLKMLSFSRKCAAYETYVLSITDSFRQMTINTLNFEP